MQRLFLALLLCAVMGAGCLPRKDTQLYLYCNETFWYVMQEEALFFNKNFDCQVILIPIRAERTVHKTEDSVEVGTNRRALNRWQSMPVQREQTDSPLPHTQINPDIEQQLERISETHFGDLFLSDSPRHVEKIHDTALSTKEYPVCYLTLTMLVPEGNPHRFRSIKDVLDTNRKLGVMNPSFDGLGEASWKVLSKIVPGGEAAIPMELVQFYERQYDLMEALELGDIDAALVWNTASQINYLLVKYAEEYNEANEKEMRSAERKKDREALRILLQAMYKHLVETRSFAEEVPLTNNPDERFVTAIRLIALSSALDWNRCERFADFMRSKQGKMVLQRFGFVPE